MQLLLYWVYYYLLWLRVMFKLANHPIHPALVHFPIVFWTSTTGLDVVNIFLNDEFIWRASYYLLLVGNITAVVAVISGVFELDKVKTEEAWSKLKLHIVFNLVSFLLYGAALWAKIQSLGEIGYSRAEILFSLWGFVTLLIAAFHGGGMVYGHKVGVNSD